MRSLPVSKVRAAIRLRTIETHVHRHGVRVSVRIEAIKARRQIPGSECSPNEWWVRVRPVGRSDAVRAYWCRLANIQG